MIVRSVRVGLLLALGACAGGSQATPEPDTRPPSGVVDPPVDAETLLDDRLPAKPAARVHRPRPWPFDILHYDISVRPDFAEHALSGAVTIRLRALEPGLRELPLDAVDFTGVAVRDARGDAVPFRQEAERIVVRPSEPFPVDADWICTITWDVRPIGGAYFNGPTVAEPDAPRSVYTQGECEDTRLWMPCHDFPDDRASHAMSLTLPDGMQAVAAGRRLPSQPGVRPGETTHRFRMDTPHVAYLTTFAAGDLEIRTAEGVTPLEFLCEARDRDLIVPSLRHTDEILRAFAELTGRAYPYSKYAQVTVREFDFGGMENISASTLTDRTLHPLAWEPERSSRGLVAHEAAHQWFGDLITCKHWAHIWLNEGFATYYEILHRGRHEGRDGLLLGLRGARRSGLGAFDREPRPVVTYRYADPFDLFDGHAYGGGAARLHMLRDLLGEATFERLVKTYIRRFENGLVTTEDFEALASEVAGSDLSWWFDQWLRGAGYPRLQVRSSWSAEDRAARVVVKQTQKTANGVPAAFRVPLTVAFLLPDGREVRRRLNVRRRSQTFTVPLPDAPRRVRPDPDTVLLARLDEGRSIADLRFDLWTDPNPARRLDAAEELGKRSRNKKATAEDREAALAALLETVEIAPGHALHDFARNVAIPPIRRTVVTELGRSKDARSRQAVAALLASPPDLRVELAALRAVGSQGAPALPATRDALLAAARGGHELKRAAALRSLAKCRVEGASKVLLEALPTRGYQAVVRTAALDGLADLALAGEREALLPHLLRHAGPESELETRSAVLRALGRVGKGHAGPGSAVRAVVLEALRDPGRRQRKAAADACKALAEPDLLPHLVAAFRAEPWKRTRRSLRGAIVATRKAAVHAGRGVSVETVSALELWARYTDLGAARAAPDADVAALDAERKEIAATLRGLGVGLPPKPPAEGTGDGSGE